MAGMTLSLPAALASGILFLLFWFWGIDRIALGVRRWQGRRAYRRGYLQELKDTKTKSVLRAWTASDYPTDRIYRVH